MEPAQPVPEVPETAAPERPESSAVVASSAALGEAGGSGKVADASSAGLGASSSGPPTGGASWAVVQRGVPKDFVRAEHEEEEIWQEQFNLGVAIDADLQHVVQRHWREAYNINRVGALSAPTHFLLRL